MNELFFLYNKINMILYFFQHLLYSNLSFHDKSIHFSNLLSLTFIGILTSVTPCFISILPLFISSTNTFVNFNLFTKIMLVLGVTSSLLVVITLLYLCNSQLSQFLNKVPLISSFIFISLSLNLLGITNLALSLEIFNLKDNSYNNIYLQSYLSGLGIGLSSLPCNASIMLTTILWLYDSNRIFNSLTYLFVYLLGCVLPFLIFFLLPFKLVSFQKFIYFWNYIVSFAGFYMLTFGLFTFIKQLL